MIEIKDKSKCCGCAACVVACPVKCISFNEDEQGFLYPNVDLTTCINCHLCEKVCPFLNDSPAKKPVKVYSAKNQDQQVRFSSSSGGIFTAIAEYIITNEGVVFGARFNDNWEIIHGYTETKEGINEFRRSKYSQSIIGNTFKEAQELLKDGRLVLFTGTPCQIEGLKRFLRKDYDNLYTLEVVCHAVPSPKIWRDYLVDITKRNEITLDKISFINFRDKRYGWKDFSMLIQAGDKVLVNDKCSLNLYLKGFINNLFIRPSCFNCPSKGGRSGGDFSLADFWAINQFLPKCNDNKGTTLLYVNSDKGLKLLDNLEIEKKNLDCSQNLNIAYSHSTREKYPIDKFWRLYSDRGLEAIEIICKKMKPNPIAEFFRRGFGFINRKLS